jgi:GT2 family glycosyltransferase
MSMRRRLQDALSRPDRLFWFVTRAVYLAVTGRIGHSITQLFPQLSGASNYQEWITETEAKQDLSHVLDPSVTISPPVAFLIASTGATIPYSVVSSGEQTGRSKCWLTCASEEGWREPVQWATVLPNTALTATASRPRKFLDLLSEVERQAGLPVWVIFIDDNVVLDANCLAIIATTASRWPMARLIYSDHDEIRDGRRERPMFKPAWDPVQIQERNFIGSSCAIEASLLRGIWGRVADRRCELDVLLQECSRTMQPGEALHVPRVLWHTVTGGDPVPQPAPPLMAKPADVAQVTLPHGERPLASIIIPAKDHPDLTRACIDSLLSLTRGCTFEILLVDNGSAESTMWEYYQRELSPKGVRLQVYPGAFNFSELCNAGAASSLGRVLVFLNNDTEIISTNWLTELCGLALREECGAAGPLLLHADGSIQHAGILMGINGSADRVLVNVRPDHEAAAAWFSSRRVVGAVLGACLAVERDKYCAIGGMDPRYEVSHNEVDLCLRLARAGYMSVFTPHVRLIHLESGTRGYDLTPSQRAKLSEESARFKAQWGQHSTGCDPAYHPNLRRDGKSFALAAEVPPCVPRTGWRAAVLSTHSGQAEGRVWPGSRARPALSA